MRTNIELDDALLAEVAEVMGTRSKRSTVEAALREVIRVHALRRLADLRLDIEDTRGTAPR